MIDLLAGVALFGDFTEEELQRLAGIGNRRAMAAGETVFRAGEPGDSLYVILAGAVRVFQAHEEGEEVELVSLRAGDSFGEMSLIDGSPRSATVETVEPCEFFLIGREPFLDLIARSRMMLEELLTGFTGRVRQGNEKLLRLALEKERQRARAEIARHRAIAQMVAGVAHEINTPLGIINQAASVITDLLRPAEIRHLAREDPEAEESLADVADAARLILSNAARARDLVTSFKNLSVRQVTDRRETVDFGKLVEEVAGLYRFQARASRLELVLRDELGDDPGGRAWDGYPGYLSQIVLNLLSNVDRYAYPDGGGGRVEITLRRGAGKGGRPEYELGVQDFGRGIPEADLPQIFDPFFSTGRGKGGTGLGLSIVYNLATDALQGSIGVESRPGEGTHFTLRVPSTVPETASRHPAGGAQGDQE